MYRYLKGRCLQRPGATREETRSLHTALPGVASNAFVAIVASLFLFFTTGIAQQTPGQETAPLSAEAQEAASQGVSFFRQNQLPEAREQFEKVSQLAPTHPFGWVNLGSTDFRLGQTDRAEEELKKAVRLDPIAEQAWLTLGIISYQKDALDAG